MSDSETVSETSVANTETTVKPPYHINPYISAAENIRLMLQHYFPKMKFENSQDMFDNVHMWITDEDFNPEKITQPPNDTDIYLRGGDAERKLYLCLKSVSHDGFHGFRKIVLKNVIPYTSNSNLNNYKDRLPIVVKFNQPHAEVLKMTSYSLSTYTERSNNPYWFIENTQYEACRKVAKHLGMPEWAASEWYIGGGRCDHGKIIVDGKHYLVISLNIRFSNTYATNALHLADKCKHGCVFYAPASTSHNSLTFYCYAAGNDFDEWHAQNASS